MGCDTGLSAGFVVQILNLFGGFFFLGSVIGCTRYWALRHQKHSVERRYATHRLPGQYVSSYASSRVLISISGLGLVPGCGDPLGWDFCHACLRHIGWSGIPQPCSLSFDFDSTRHGHYGSLTHTDLHLFRCRYVFSPWKLTCARSLSAPTMA